MPDFVKLLFGSFINFPEKNHYLYEADAKKDIGTTSKVQFDSRVTVANRYSDNSSKQVKVTDTIVIK